MPKYVTEKTADERYLMYVENVKRKGRKIQIEDPVTGEVKTTFKWFSKESLYNMKCFCEAYEMVTQNRGFKGRTLIDSVNFARKAIEEKGWETDRGNLRKVSVKMRYLVDIYDGKYKKRKLSLDTIQSLHDEDVFGAFDNAPKKKFNALDASTYRNYRR